MAVRTDKGTRKFFLRDCVVDVVAQTLTATSNDGTHGPFWFEAVVWANTEAIEAGFPVLPHLKVARTGYRADEKPWPENVPEANRC